MQELSHADKEEAGRVPRTLEVELTRDLVDSCSAGDVVTVLGIIKVLSTDAEAGRLFFPSTDSYAHLRAMLATHASVIMPKLQLKSLTRDTVLEVQATPVLNLASCWLD